MKQEEKSPEERGLGPRKNPKLILFKGSNKGKEEPGRREENQVSLKSQKLNFCEGRGVMEGNIYIVRYCFKGREAEMEKEMATHSSILA